MPDMAEKTCSKCGERKSLEEFHTHKHTQDGRQSSCKACHRTETRAWASANRERKATTIRDWRERNPERRVEETREWRERNPEKARAHRAVNNAIKVGKLTKPDHCEDCGEATESLALHGHHEDYAKPLEVEWLCRGCHTQRHPPALTPA